MAGLRPKNLLSFLLNKKITYLISKFQFLMQKLSSQLQWIKFIDNLQHKLKKYMLQVKITFRFLNLFSISYIS